MPRIDEWVVRRLLDLLERDDSGTRIYAINLSGQSIGDPDVVQRVVAWIEQSGLDRSRLCFERTETAVIANLDTAQQFMTVARGMGANWHWTISAAV